jgi:hypothetical protein
MIASNNTRGSINLYANSSSEQHSDPNVKFLVDIDSHEDLVFSKSVITELFVQSIDPKPGRIISEISTPNGIHLITTPFEINKFRESCPTISVYKDAPTVLYSPVSVTDSTCEIPI